MTADTGAPGHRVLVVEDEQKLGDAIATSLAETGFDVTLTPSGEDGFYLATTRSFDAVVLDLNLPGRDGTQILGSLRDAGIDVPLLILTARDGLDDRVQGLDLGADDYLTKPFAFAELHARIRAIMRRGRVSEEQTVLRCADLVLDRLERQVLRDGQNIELTTKEFEMLECLLRNRGHVVARDTLARELWGERARVVALDNVIDVHMARLRAKVDNPFDMPLIHTVRGVGFSLRERAL